MNPSTALARTLVDELIRGGVREAVLAPGSRSAPLAFALHDADRAGRLRLHVRIDERSASFLALGLAKASGTPVPVVTTSGTATANLHPAVLEASYAGVPLLVLTADRPPELRGTGANQTVDQIHLYGEAVRLFVEVGAPALGEEPYWRGLTCRALAAAQGDLTGTPGPVHLNLAFRDPLVPSEGTLTEGRADGGPWTARAAQAVVAPADDLPDRTLVVLGDTDPDTAAQAQSLAVQRGWPIVAEPSSSAAGPLVVRVPELLLADTAWLEEHRPDRVLVVGRPTLSRVVAQVIRNAPADVVAAGGTWPDASHHASRVLSALPMNGSSHGQDGPPGTTEASGYGEAWIAEAQRRWSRVEPLLDALSEPHVARAVVDAAAELLVVGSSKPVRDLFLVGGRHGLRILANRGAAGIDGMVSTAVGAALAHGRPTFALMGDLTFLHDSNGLLIGPDEARPDLTVVVVNNDGGAIFGLLEQGAPEHAEAFERIFGTAHGTAIDHLCAAHEVPHTLATSAEELREALVGKGLRVVEVRTDRTAAVELDRAIRRS